MILYLLNTHIFFFSVWWPFFVVLFYVLSPIPTLLARRCNDVSGTSSSALEGAIFLTMFIVISSFALPIVLARSPTDMPVVSIL